MEFEGKDYDNISQELQVGMICHIHKESGKLETIPEGIEDAFDSDLMWEESEDQESWGSMLQRFEKNMDDYYILQPMDSRESFRIMEDFAHFKIDDESFQKEVLSALSRKGPFRNFKDLVEYNPEYRQAWFDYRDERYRQYVKDSIHITKEDDAWDEEE